MTGRKPGSVNGLTEREEDREPPQCPPSIPHQMDKIRKLRGVTRAALLRAPFHVKHNPAGAPHLPKSWTDDKRCDLCKLGDHDKCVGTKCWGCKHPDHDRGTKGLGVNSGTRRFEVRYPDEWGTGSGKVSPVSRAQTYRQMGESYVAATTT